MNKFLSALMRQHSSGTGASGIVWPWPLDLGRWRSTPSVVEVTEPRERCVL